MYAVSARIERVRPRVLAAEWTSAREAADGEAVAAVAPGIGVDAVLYGDRDLELRWVAFRERWSQLTFYLFDPESWR